MLPGAVEEIAEVSSDGELVVVESNNLSRCLRRACKTYS